MRPLLSLRTVPNSRCSSTETKVLNPQVYSTRGASGFIRARLSATHARQFYKLDIHGREQVAAAKITEEVSTVRMLGAGEFASRTGYVLREARAGTELEGRSEVIALNGGQHKSIPLCRKLTPSIEAALERVRVVAESQNPGPRDWHGAWRRSLANFEERGPPCYSVDVLRGNERVTWSLVGSRPNVQRKRADPGVKSRRLERGVA